MKTLLILRHAKSSWKESELPDHDRPLNKRGRQDAPRMGSLLRAQDLLPDLIISSTAIRAQATAEALIETSGYEGELQLTRAFYAAGPQAFVNVLRQLPDKYGRVMVIGHNPGLEELIEELTGEEESLPTAGLALVMLSIQNWTDLDEVGQDQPAGKLVEIWRPKVRDEP